MENYGSVVKRHFKILRTFNIKNNNKKHEIPKEYKQDLRRVFAYQDSNFEGHFYDVGSNPGRGEFARPIQRKRKKQSRFELLSRLFETNKFQCSCGALLSDFNSCKCIHDLKGSESLINKLEPRKEFEEKRDEKMEMVMSGAVQIPPGASLKIES